MEAFKASVQAKGLEARVRCIGADLTEVPLEEATVVSVYRLLDTASISTGGPSAPT